MRRVLRDWGVPVSPTNPSLCCRLFDHIKITPRTHNSHPRLFGERAEGYLLKQLVRTHGAQWTIGHVIGGGRRRKDLHLLLSNPGPKSPGSGHFQGSQLESDVRVHT